MNSEEIARIKGMLSVEKIRNDLTPNEIKALEAFYGFGEGESPCTAEEAAKKLNTSDEKVRDDIESAVRKLRHPTRIKWYEESIANK